MKLSDAMQNLQEFVTRQLGICGNGESQMLINYPVEQLLLRIISTPLNVNLLKQPFIVEFRFATNLPYLESQAERLLNYCSFKGYSVVRVVKEVGSGVNDNRRKLVKLLQENDYDLIVCEHKDRLSRVGFNYLKVLLTQTNRDIEVVNLAKV